jgi:hypothetical protein
MKTYTHQDLEAVVAHFESVAADYVRTSLRTHNVNVIQRRRDQAAAFRRAAELLRMTIEPSAEIQPEPLLRARG